MQFIKLDSNEKSNVGLLEYYTKNLSILEFMEIEAGGHTLDLASTRDVRGWRVKEKVFCFHYICFSPY